MDADREEDGTDAGERRERRARVVGVVVALAAMAAFAALIHWPAPAISAALGLVAYWIAGGRFD